MKALIFLWSSWLIAPICSKVAPQFWGLARRQAMRCLWCLSLCSHDGDLSEEKVSVWLIFYITAENSTTELMNAYKHGLCIIIWTHRFLPYSHYVIKLLQPKDKAVFALDCRLMCECWFITVTRCSSTYQPVTDDFSGFSGSHVGGPDKSKTSFFLFSDFNSVKVSKVCSLEALVGLLHSETLYFSNVTKVTEDA